MPADRTLFRKNIQKFFTNLDRWQPDPENFYRDALEPGEAEQKAKEYPDLIVQTAKQARAKVDPNLDLDTLRAHALGKMNSASLYYYFTGNRKALKWAIDALDILDTFERPHFCYITLIGRVDIDLQTASVTRALSAMRSCFADALDEKTAHRLERIAIIRCLQPALEAMQTRKYWWTECTHNWRSVMAGSFAIGGMAFSDVFDNWKELVEYGLEGILVVLEEGDRAGGWQEGPGYWEYGIGHCAEFAASLKLLTRGKVNLFQHRYLKNTGDFRIYMTPSPRRVWNWSDGGKIAGSSITLSILAREYQNSAYQAAALQSGVVSLQQLFHLDLNLKKQAPTAGTRFPLTRIFPDNGLAVMRTGFKKNDTFVGVKAGIVGPEVNHEHVDPGSLVIFAAGRELLAELDSWPYAQTPSGKASGFFDKGGRRWDYDGNGIIGHNLVLLEGRYPPFSASTRTRLKHVELDANNELVIVDSTAVHRALAHRVRRYVVFLRPDIVLLVDDIRARERIRTRCLFHYLDRASVEPDSFTFASGSARLHGQSIYPSVEENIILGKEERLITYHTERGRTDRTNNYVYTANLHRSKDLVFVTGLHFGRHPLPKVQWSLDSEPTVDAPFTVTVGHNKTKRNIRFNLSAGTVEV
ncbi:MAG: heparinase II/III family protein [bacterium]|nr:heparinase II/III family protein [bacterium]